MTLKITTGKIFKARTVVIHGQEGVGKSTIAKDFPSPLFMDVEDSTLRMDVARLPKPQTWSEAFQQVQSLTVSPPAGYQTLVIDTWDRLLLLNQQHVVLSRPREDGQQRDTIEQFGWGRGYTFMAEECARFLDALSELRDKQNWNILLLCHTGLRKFELPEEEGGYDRWEMKVERRPQAATSCFSLTKEWPEMLFFARYKTIVEAEDNGKRKGRGQTRVMQTEHNAVWDAKNRDGLKPELPLEFKSIAHLFRNEPPASTANRPVAPPAPTKEAQPVPPAPAPTPGDVITPNMPAHLAKLEALMSTAGVTHDEIMAVIITKGYFEKGTEFTSLPADFVETKAIPYFHLLVEKVLANRKGVAA